MRYPKEWANSNYYISLGVDPSADFAEINSRYLSLNNLLANASEEPSRTAEMKNGLQQAYTTLTDPKLRTKYDKFLIKIHKYSNVGVSSSKDTGFRYIFVSIILGLLLPTIYAVNFSVNSTTEFYDSLMSGAGIPGETASSALLSDGSFILTLQVLFWVGLLVGPLLASIFGNYKFMGKESMFNIGFKWKWILWGLAFGLIAQILSISIALLIQQAYGKESATGNGLQVAEAFAGLNPLIIFAMLALGAPIVEEIFYRGLVFTALSNRLGLLSGGIISSVLFGISHYQGSGYNALFVVILTSSLGGLLAYARYKSGGIFLPIMIHVAFNSLSAVALIFAGDLLLPQ